MGSGQAWAGTGPPSPTCPEALSDTSLWAERQALSRPLETGSSCLAMSLLQGAPFQEPRGLAIGQHNNHSGSCGLSAPLGQQGRTPRGLRGVCFPVRAPSRLLCPGCTTREEGHTFPVTPGDHTVGRQPGLLTPGTISPHPPPHHVLLKQRPCCVQVSRPGHERKPKTGQSGEGVKGSHARGALVFCRRKRRSARKGQKQENTTPTSRHVSPPPACASPRPQLMTKEKHAATLMRLGKCCFTNTARSSGLTP